LNKIGRKLYFDVATGEVILDTGEKMGSVIATTVERDIETYKVLSERNRETFDVIELPYGFYNADFSACNSYRVNPETKEIEFSYPDPNEPEVEQPYRAPLGEEVERLQKENTLLKAQNSALTERTDFHEEVLTEIILTIAP